MTWRAIFARHYHGFYLFLQGVDLGLQGVDRGTLVLEVVAQLEIESKT
jgi:hypothetical protein